MRDQGVLNLTYTNDAHTKKVPHTIMTMYTELLPQTRKYYLVGCFALRVLVHAFISSESQSVRP